MQVDWKNWTPQIRANLCFVRKGNEVLLIRKKRGLGAGKVNAPGGKIEPGEEAKDAAIRETLEEVGVRPIEPVYRGELFFQFVDGLTIHCAVFQTDRFEGEPIETDEAIPFWSGIDAIPYDEMWEDDRYWLPGMLAGNCFRGYFTFDGDRMLSRDVEVTPCVSMDSKLTFDAAIFDIGNVLLNFDFADAFRRMGHEGIDLLRGQAGWTDLKIRYETGLMERAAFVAEAIKAMNFSGAAEEFIKIWQDIFTLNLPMWEVVESLRKRMPIYLLSNTNDLHVEVFTRQAEGFAHFADAIYSHEVKLMKPDPAIFELAVRRFKVEPARTIYIDDLPENVAAAKRAGIDAIEYRPDRHNEFLDELRRRGWK